MTLRALGTWSEQQWQVVPGPKGPIAVKWFHWTCPAVLARTSQPIDLKYQAFARAVPRDLERIQVLAGIEARAIGTLERMIEAGRHGMAFIAAPDPGHHLRLALRRRFQPWAASQSWPDDWQTLVDAAVAEGMAASDQQVRAYATIGAEPPREQGQVDWTVPIEPLVVPDVEVPAG